MAREFWPNDDAIGARISLGSKATAEPSTALEIVGVAGDVRERTDRSTDPQGNIIYMPLPQTSDAYTSYIVRIPTIWMVRTRVEPHSLSSAIKNELVQASRGLAVVNIRSMDEIESASTARQDFNMVLMLIFGGSALLLAAIGIYGLMAFSVEQRTQRNRNPHRPRSRVEQRAKHGDRARHAAGPNRRSDRHSRIARPDADSWKASSTECRRLIQWCS